MRSKEFYPFIRGKPNPLIYNNYDTQIIHPGEAETFIRGRPLMVGDHLPRGEPQGLKNCRKTPEIRGCLSKTFFNKCRSDIPGSREISRKGGIQGYLLT